MADKDLVDQQVQGIQSDKDTLDEPVYRNTQKRPTKNLP